MNYREHVAYDQGATAAYFAKARTPPAAMQPSLTIQWLYGYDQQKRFESGQMELFNDEANYTQEARVFQGRSGDDATNSFYGSGAPVHTRAAPAPAAVRADRGAAVHEARMQQPVETMAVVEDAWEQHQEPLHHADMQLGMFNGDGKRGN